MLQSRAPRRLVIATLLGLALTLLPILPAAATPADGWALRAAPAAWTLLWRFMDQVLGVKLGASSDQNGADPEVGDQVGSDPDPWGAAIEIGAQTDPDGTPTEPSPQADPNS